MRQSANETTEMAAVNSLKMQFERLSTTVDSETPTLVSSPDRSRNPKPVDKLEPKQSPTVVSKRQLKQIGKTINSATCNPSEKRISKTCQSKSVEVPVESAAVAVLADVINSSPKSSSGGRTPLTKSADFDDTTSSLSASHTDTGPNGEILLRIRVNSTEEREMKGHSAPLPLVQLKPKAHVLSTTSPKLKPKLAPKPLLAAKPTPSPKPSLPPKPKIIPNKKNPPNPSLICTDAAVPKVSTPEQISNETNETIPEMSSVGTIKPTTPPPIAVNDDISDVSLPHEVASDDSNVSPLSKLVQDLSLSDTVVSTPPLLQNNDEDECATIHVQSSATATPNDEVGSCKRNAVDSGYQEGTTEEHKWDANKRIKAREKRKLIALELLETERTYVGRLKIIAQDFRQAIQTINTKSNKAIIPESTICIIFLNIGEIYNLNKQLLCDLEARMDNWSENEQIGDVISSIAPFLKLYSMYTAGFEDAMKKLTETMAKEKKLDITVKEFERNLGTGLGVAHYMLEPVQRIPRYKLLLEAYLKSLPEDSSERSSTTKALEIIGEAADKTNNRIKELENSNEILAIQRTILDYEGTLLLAHRRFIKKGILQKLSRKTQAPRMFFLFSDVLLHTEPTGPSTYKFKNELPLCAVKMELPKVSLVPHSFELLSTNRSFILSAKSEDEMIEWMTALRGAIRDDKEKMKSLKRGEQLLTLDRSGFGNSAPILVPDQSVSMCQICSKEYTFTFRRHHCRACGRVVCGNCSPHKVYLTYTKKEERICSVCNHQRKQSAGDDIDGEAEHPISRARVPSVLIVSLSAKRSTNIHETLNFVVNVIDKTSFTEYIAKFDHENEAIIGGYVLEQDGKKWNRCWYVVGKDFALYKFKAHEDIRATETVPLPGYRITTDRVTMTINLLHHQAKNKKLNLSFRTESVADFETWVDVIEKASLLVVSQVAKSPEYRMSSASYSSNRTRSQSLHDLIDPKPLTVPPAPMTPPVVQRSSMSAAIDSNDCG